MYESHFGLAQMPFGSKPNPAFFYAGAVHGELLGALRYAMTQDEGVIQVIGAAGSGKTMLCCVLESVLSSTIDVVYLPASNLSAARMIDFIADRLSLSIEGKNTDAVFRLLHGHLIRLHARGRKVVLLVDDAHLMPTEVLEQIRLLTNLEHDRSQLLRIALFGRPQLQANLKAPYLQRFQQRIMHSFEIAPIAPQHVPALLACRLRAAAYSGPALFTQGALVHIIKTSMGNLRQINLLAGKSLLTTFNDQARVITVEHVQAAMMGRAKQPAQRRGKRMWYAGAVLAALLFAAAVWQATAQDETDLTSNYQLQQLQQLLASTKVWLSSEPGTHLALQIIVLPVTKQAQISDFLRSMRDQVDLQRVHAYPLRINGVDSIGISYGSFETSTQAELVQKQLQHSFHAQIHSVNALREQIQQGS